MDAQLVVESKAPSTGRGRPRLLYAIDAAAAGRWGTAGPYERLSRLLVEVIRTGLEPAEVGRRAAERFRAPAPTGDVVADVSSAMARHGFDPEIRPESAGAELALRTCPFAEVAVADRSTICALHLGIAEGLVSGTDTRVVELVAYDPHRAGCRLRLDGAKPSRTTSPSTLSLRTRTPRPRSEG